MNKSINNGMFTLIGWAGFDKELTQIFAVFKKLTGIEVKFIACRNQDEMLALVESNKKIQGFADIASPTTDRLASWMQSDLIQAWDEEKINFEGIDAKYHVDQQTLIQGKRMGSPNLWGGAGIAHHRYEAPLQYSTASLIDLFDDTYFGKLTMREDTAFVAAGRALENVGGLPYTFDESYYSEHAMVKNYDTILDFLLSKKKNVKGFWFSEDEARDAFFSKHCSIGYCWDTTAASLQQQKLPIDFLSPVEGTNCYLQNFVLLKGAKNIKQANAWVSWVNTPEGGAMFAKAYRAFSPSLGSLDVMSPKEKRSFETFYPPSALEKLWWQPEQKTWFVHHRKHYAKIYKST